MIPDLSKLFSVYFESPTEIRKLSQESKIYKDSIKQTWVCVVDLLSFVYGNKSYKSNVINVLLFKVNSFTGESKFFKSSIV